MLVRRKKSKMKVLESFNHSRRGSCSIIFLKVGPLALTSRLIRNVGEQCQWSRNNIWEKYFFYSWTLSFSFKIDPRRFKALKKIIRAANNKCRTMPNKWPTGTNKWPTRGRVLAVDLPRHNLCTFHRQIISHFLKANVNARLELENQSSVLSRNFVIFNWRYFLVILFGYW